MAFRLLNGGASNGASGNSGLRNVAAEYSGDERESRSGGEDRTEIDLHDKPIYLLEHLATFTVNKDSGIVYPADGMRRLLQLEKTTGIWSQKMQLCLDHQWVLIMDYETGMIIERFPASLIQEPTAFTSTDAMELYNNILVFIVSGGSESRSEMHIFQSQSVSAVHLVEDLKNLRSGKMITQQRHHQHQNSASSSNMNKSIITTIHNRSDYLHQHQHHHHHHNETDSEHGGVNDETSSTSSDKYERDVSELNSCFDEIEKFIARLQHAAAASRELERRRRNRKTKKKDPGEGLLTLRTRPPHEKEFIDIFAKFKQSFNLLAKLKAHIHDPNAPELVHFLFTPLALIVEASSDTYCDAHLPARVLNPMLTREAINLLINCVTSKETELWRSLGDAWWSPDYLTSDEVEHSTTTTTNKRHIDSQGHHSNDIRSGSGGGGGGVGGGRGANAAVAGVYDDYDGSPVSLVEKYNMLHAHTHLNNEPSERVGASGPVDFSTRSEISVDSIDRSGLASHSAVGHNSNSSGPNAAVMQAITEGIQNLHARDNRGVSGAAAGAAYGSSANSNNVGIEMNSARGGGIASGVGAKADINASDDQVIESWLDHLQAAGAKIVLVTYPRTANNDKELSVVRGEYLEILDDSRKWWKARNIRGQIAHVPHTIVTPYNYGDNEHGNQFYGHQGNYKLRHTQNTSNNVDNNEQRTNDSNYWSKNKHLDSDHPASLSVANAPREQSISPKDGIQEELRHVLRMREKRSDLDIHKTPTIYIQQNSSAKDVAKWLRAKEFSETIVQLLAAYDGEHLFAMPTKTMEQLCGPKEGRRLASQIKLQKSVSGYKTARSSELQAVLARARPKSDL